MSRPKDHDVTLCCPLNQIEQDFAALMMADLGIDTEANLVRVCLRRMADHMQLRIGNQVFKPRVARGLKPESRMRQKSRELAS